MNVPAHWPTASDWTSVLQHQFESESFQRLSDFVASERSEHIVYPPPLDVYRAFRLTPFCETRVVILGQDPYHGPNQAHGLSFSVADDCKLPPSLRNIFRELITDLDVPFPATGNLSSWAQQGVLLLNSVLTVRHSAPNSHRNQGWESFTDAVIEALGGPDARPRVFLLWGKPAQKKASLIHSQHEIISSPHPSPLSARRGFFGSRPFSRSNSALARLGLPRVGWESVVESRSC